MSSFFCAGKKGQSTPIHCHNEQECWVYVVDGILDENLYQNEQGQPAFKKTERRLKSQYTFMHDDMGFHDIVNLKGHRSMTLHLYAGPVKKCRIYDEEQKAFIWHDLAYHSYNGEKLSTLA